MRPRISLLLSVLLVVALSACDGPPPLQPDRATHEDFAAGNAIATNLGVPAETRAEVIRFADLEVVDGARAGLLREVDAIRTRTHTAELTHRDVLTLWWIVFNHPEYCEHGDGELAACGEGDLFDGPEGPTGVDPSCVYADGSLVGGNGTARFHDRLRVGDVRDSCIDFFVAAVDGLEGEDYGLINPAGAEVHLVVRSHGPTIPGMVSEQRSTFAGGCQEFLMPHEGEEELEPGQCRDEQFVVFPAPNN